MSKPGDINRIERIPRIAGPILPAAPGTRHVDPGADGPFEPKPARAPTAMPKMTAAPSTIRADGGHILGRQWDGKAWGAWYVLSDKDLQVMIGDPPAPRRRPYVPGT